MFERSKHHRPPLPLVDLLLIFAPAIFIIVALM
jgi:hypothetical protein